MKSLLLSMFILALSVGMATAQTQPSPNNDRTRPVDNSKAPEQAAARYEGGLFGFSDKESGILRIDSINERIVFLGKDGKERFSLPFSALQVVYPESRSVTSNTGNIVRNIPLPGSFLGGLIKEKWRYLVIGFNDPDANVSGTISFKLSSKDLLNSTIQKIGKNAGLTQRGDSYYRPSTPRTTI